MVGLFAASAGISAQVGIEPKAVHDPDVADLLTEGEWRVVLGLQKDDVLATRHQLTACCVAQLPRIRGGFHPHVRDRHRSNEGRNEAGSRGTCHRVVDPSPAEVVGDCLYELPRSLRKDVALRIGWPIVRLFGPEVEQGRRVDHSSNPISTGTLYRDDAFVFQPGEHAVRQTQGDPNVVREILNLPFPMWIEKELFREQASLACQAAPVAPADVDRRPLDAGVVQVAQHVRSPARRPLRSRALSGSPLPERCSRW